MRRCCRLSRLHDLLGALSELVPLLSAESIGGPLWRINQLVTPFPLTIVSLAVLLNNFRFSSIEIHRCKYLT